VTGEPIAMPVDGTLDLHTFRPREIKDLIPDYLEACRQRGITQVRIVHGKGTGALRRTVHALLGRLSSVETFRTAGPDGGGWGATIVTLHPGARGPMAGSGKEDALRRSLRLETLAGRLTICRLPGDAALPAGARDAAGFVSITRTPDELSIVCAEEDAPREARSNGPWRGLRVEGPLEFSDTGVLLSLAEPLAAAGIPIFVISTHDTDYLLVRDDRIDEARRRLRDAGHTIDGE